MVQFLLVVQQHWIVYFIRKRANMQIPLTLQQKSILKKETSPGERLLRILLLGTAGIIVLTGLAFILF